MYAVGVRPLPELHAGLGLVKRSFGACLFTHVSGVDLSYTV